MGLEGDALELAAGQATLQKMILFSRDIDCTIHNPIVLGAKDKSQ